MFILAVALWFIVVSDKMYDFTFDVPLTLKESRHGLALSQPIPSEVGVKFNARGRELLRLKWIDHPRVVVDPGSSPHSRTIHLRPEMVSIPAGISVNSVEIIQPDSIEIVLDDYRTRLVPVQSSIRALPAAGYTIVGRPAIEPENVEVRGPEKNVAHIQSIQTDTISIADITRGIEIETKLAPVQAYSVRVTPESVKVRIKVEKISERILAGVQINTRNGGAGAAYRIEPQSARVKLTGASSVVTNFQVDELYAYVDLASPLGEKPGWYKLQVSAPEGVEIRTIEPDEVRVLRVTR